MPDATRTTMARASFNTLPLELKARVVEMTSDQEEKWSERVKDLDERAGHINGLSSLALVNKELRTLAAKHQFAVLGAHRASLPVFRFSILPRHAHQITGINFFETASVEEAELVLSFLGQLSGLRELSFSSEAATELFGPGVLLRQDPEDEASSYRASVLELFSSRIENLTLHRFKPSETVALIRACPNLKTLVLWDLEDADQEAQLHDLVNAIASLRHLTELNIEMDLDASRVWPTEALAALSRDPPPIKRLHLYSHPLDHHIFHLINTFSSTLRHLTLDVKVRDPPFDLTSIEPIPLPHLAKGELSCPRELLPRLFRIFTSHSDLSHFGHFSPSDDALAPTDPALLTFIKSQPSLRHLYLWDFNVLVETRSSTFPSPSFLSAYANLIRARALDSSVLDQPHLTPFHPSAKLDYTEAEHEFLTGSLRRTLQFGLLELDRMAAEGSVARTVEWVPMLKPLEAKRLAWKD